MSRVHFWVKVSNIHFLVEKGILLRKKDDVLTSRWRHKVVYPFLAYLGKPNLVINSKRL